MPHAHAYQAISSIEVLSPEPTPMSSTRSPRRSDACLLRERDRNRGRSDVAERRVRQWDTRSVELHRLHDGVRVHVGDLMHDVAVHLGPVPVLAGFPPGGGHEVHATLQQSFRVGEHAVDAADAESVELRGGARDPAEHPVALGVPVATTDHRRRCAGPQREARELAHELRAPDVPGASDARSC